MNIDQLLSPYRGFKPTGEDLIAEPGIVVPSTPSRTAVLRSTRIDRGPELLSPEAWEMYEFVQALTA